MSSYFLRAKKESLKANEVIVLRDFAGNHQFLVQNEIQVTIGVKNTAHYTHSFYILLTVMEIFNKVDLFLDSDSFYNYIPYFSSESSN